MSPFEERFRKILRTIDEAARDRAVRIIGVTKTVSPDQIREAHAAGLRTFGENRVQEALPKLAELRDLQADWHFIGHLQTNKARDAVRHFAVIHSVDSERLLMRIENEAVKMDRGMDVLLEVNLGGEESKSGMVPSEVPHVLEVSRGLVRTRIIGLMTVPPYLENPQHVRPYFRNLRELRDRHLPDYPLLTELSMGMSHDYVVAVEEGSTIVRIGTALFGERTPR